MTDFVGYVAGAPDRGRRRRSRGGRQRDRRSPFSTGPRSCSGPRRPSRSPASATTATGWSSWRRTRSRTSSTWRGRATARRPCSCCSRRRRSVRSRSSRPRWVTEGYATLVEGALTGSGRPSSSFRAMVLRQLAIEGKLPSYGALDGTGGLARRLDRVPRRLGVPRVALATARARRACRGSGSGWRPRAAAASTAAFRGIFGDSPRDLYDRFRAELTARALAEEKRLKAAGLVEGELWQRLSGGTLAAAGVAGRDASCSSGGIPRAAQAASPSGRSRRRPRSARRKGAPPRGRRARARSRTRSRTGPRSPAPREPGWTLPRADGFAAADPRWMPDGRAVLFSRRAPDADGMLRWDLYRWSLERGERLARDALRRRRATRIPRRTARGPSPCAAASARRRSCAWTSRPGDARASGRAAGRGGVARLEPSARLAGRHGGSPPSLHAGGAWRLVTLPAEGGEVARRCRCPGAPASAPAWSADGSRLFVDERRLGDLEHRRRSTRRRASGAAAADARDRRRVRPGSDAGRERRSSSSSFTARGVDVRRLALGGPRPGRRSSAPADAYPLAAPARPSTAAPSPRRPASAAAALRRLADAGGPSAARLLVRALGQHRAARRGQRRRPRPPAPARHGIDRQRRRAARRLGRGGLSRTARRARRCSSSRRSRSRATRASRRGRRSTRSAAADSRASWARPFTWGRVEARAGRRRHATSRPSRRERRSRGPSARPARAAAWRRTRGRSGFGFDAGRGRLARRDRRVRVEPVGRRRARDRHPSVREPLGRARATATPAARPSLFDLFAIGGAPSAILPPGLDRNRIENPALPADLQAGERFEAFRAELAGNDGPDRPLRGLAARLERRRGRGPTPSASRAPRSGWSG